MPASIIVTNISWASPDNKSLFTNLSFCATTQRIGIVGRNGVGKSTLLHLINGDLPLQSGHISTPPSMRLLAQDQSRSSSARLADIFDLGFDIDLLEKAETGIASSAELASIDWQSPFQAQSALTDFDINLPLTTPLAALSGGQHTRALMAAAFSSNADFLLLDEPTNNLDHRGRKALFSAITKWKNGLLLVSHDEELLGKVDEIIEINSIGATRYGGNFSAYIQQKSDALELAKNQLTRAQKSLKDQSAQSQRIAENKSRKDTQANKARAKNDAPKILLDAKQDRAEATKGANAISAAKAKQKAQSALTQAQDNLEILEPLTITLPKTNTSGSAKLVIMSDVDFEYTLEKPILQNISLEIIGPERVALSGPNGSGKSTLIKLITRHLQPTRGAITTTPQFALLDQTMSLLNPHQTVEQNFMRLNTNQPPTNARTILARFLFRNTAALKLVSALSGGEKMRAALACVFGSLTPPNLLILDEPTNHLDREAKAELLSALNNYDGGLLVVSHDTTFIDALNITRIVTLPAHD